MKHLVFATGIILAIGLCYGVWQAGKWFNYKFAYESGVEFTVKKMVKPECLIP